MTRKEKREFLTKLAQKSILFKPIVFDSLYRLSTKKRKEIVEETIEKYTKSFNLSKKDKKRLKKDMIYCRVFYNLSFKEYFLFGFKNKCHFKRKNFIANMNRQNYLYLLGEKEGQEILNDKYKSYEILKKFYKRELIKIGENNYTEFQKFIKKYPVFVKKPIDSSFGKGIELIDSKDFKNPKTLFSYLLEDGDVILEERIIQHEKMASLHPESLNTLRIVTYRDENDQVFIHLPFIKIGRGSSFVDNGGAGGMFARINPETGELITDGKDENNTVYEYHPDTNIKIKGFKIPSWEKAVSLAKDAALAFDKTRYIGWDVAIDKDGNPLIVEGNGKTQFLGQQITDEGGKRKDLEKLINYKKLKKENKTNEKWELPVNN
ncbi:MAG: sugar-transfer associated ATP-grasp domain-containing protein [Bacilli bacterium]